MFNNKLKQEIRNKNDYIKELLLEIERLQQFNERIDLKIEELCKPKMDNLCLSLLESGITASKKFVDESFRVLNKQYDNTVKAFEKHAEKINEEINILKKRDEENKKLLSLLERQYKDLKIMSNVTLLKNLD